jgi:hypothetical protein
VRIPLMLKGPTLIVTYRWASKLILSIAYGIDVRPSNDPFVALARHAVHQLAQAGVPGKYLVVSFHWPHVLVTTFLCYVSRTPSRF